MGTKQLMADRRVAEVGLGDNGKAATLTLAPGWTYEGSSGPFTLKNVEHGHQIVRGATADGSVAKAPRARKAATPGQPSPPGDNPGPSFGDKKPLPRFDAPLKPRGEEIIVYRLQLMPKGDPRETTEQGKEVCGWIKITHELSKAELAQRTWSQLRSYIKGADETTHEVRSFRWTNEHQKKARENQELGSPWHGMNHGD